jgi:hypothetical protein
MSDLKIAVGGLDYFAEQSYYSGSGCSCCWYIYVNQ